jgi:hypothetical protein
MSHWYAMVWIRIRDIFIILRLSILCRELCLLVSWCVGDRCDMTGSYEDHGRSRRLDAEDWEWSSTGQILSGWMIGRSSDDVCGLYCIQGNEERGFLCWASKPRSTDFLVWASKPAAAVWWLWPQNHCDGFLIWASKPSERWFVSCATKLTGGGWHETHIEI